MTNKPDKPLPLFDHRLRPYQKEAQQALRRDFKAGHKALLMELPTGTGKTPTFVLMPREGARTLVIVPFISLIGQTVGTIRKLRECEPDIEQADLSATPECEFVVASWQTLHSNERWRKFIGKVDLVIVDEAHHGFTIESRDILKALIEGGARVVGCTATAYRADKTSLLGLYEKVSYTYSLRQAIADGYLVGPRCRIHYVKSINLKGLAKASGNDFSPEELDRIIRQEEVQQEIASLFNNTHERGAKALMFCHSVKQAAAMQELISTRYDIGTSLVHSYMSPGERQDQLDAYMKGPHELIVNVGVLTTGWSFDSVREIYMAKPTKSLAKFTQMLGRGTRHATDIINNSMTKEERLAAIAASDKPFFTVHDLTDSSRCHKLQTCIDVLAGQHGDVKEKVKRRAEEKPLEIDEIDEAVAEEIEAEKEQRRLEKQEEIERRRKLVISMEFDEEERNLFLDPDRDTPKRREYRMIFGKYKGQPLRNIKISYLEWALREANLTPFWRDVISAHVDFRRAMARRQQENGG